MTLIALGATLLLAATAIATTVLDPCERQPFRGRCPAPKAGSPPSRSQFVLRYYMRNGECVSYPFGHCANDESEPQLFRYKEECEDACLAPGNLGTPNKDAFAAKPKGSSTSTVAASSPTASHDETYGTLPPLGKSTDAPATSTTLSMTPDVSTEPSTDSSTSSSTTAPTTTTSEPRTECERSRAHASRGLVRGGFVPACDVETGAFERTQCEPDGMQCFCVNDHGIEMANSRTRDGRGPDCDGISTAASPRTNECVGAPEPGPCSAQMTHWHYDEASQMCRRFAYSGCGGNGNNYETEEACRKRCEPAPVSALECEKGQPLRNSHGYYINCAKQACPSGYSCSVTQGQSVCCEESNKQIGALDSGVSSHDVCTLPKERGPCDKYELRFYYNSESQECKYFFFGGCEGNGNNFAKVEECESRCMNGTKSTTLPSTTTASTSTLPPTTTTPKTTTPPPPPTTASTPEPTPSDAVKQLLQQKRARVPMPLDTPTAESPSLDLLEGNRCAHPLDPGSCQGHFVRWFWNAEKQTCEVFTYSGCQGNGNNFASREECLSICHIAPTAPVASTAAMANVCRHDVDSGECNGVFQRWAYAGEAGECRPFTYGGCGGNGNNFASLAECVQRCHLETPGGDVCASAIDSGECSGVFQRFAFDHLMGDCRPFNYGGCGGNGNNFPSLGDCRVSCVRSQQPCAPRPPCDLARCQLLLDQRGCPFCSCPPGAGALAPIVCPSVDPSMCLEPCISFTNRLGCLECSCPQRGTAAEPPPPFIEESLLPQPQQPHSPQPSQQPIPGQPINVAFASHSHSAPTPESPAPLEHHQHHDHTVVQESSTAPSSTTTSRHTTPQTTTYRETRPPHQHHHHAAAPPAPSHVAPPAPSTRAPIAQPPSPPSAPAPSRQEAVITHETQDKRPLPPPTTAVPLPADLTDKCLQAVEAGPCDRFVERFYFDAKESRCRSFQYGGCAGNRNHFFTQRECEVHCARFSRLLSEQDPALFVISQRLSENQQRSLPFIEAMMPTKKDGTTIKPPTPTTRDPLRMREDEIPRTFPPISIDEIMAWAELHEGPLMTASPKPRKKKPTTTTTETPSTTTRRRTTTSPSTTTPRPTTTSTRKTTTTTSTPRPTTTSTTTRRTTTSTATTTTPKPTTTSQRPTTTSIKVVTTTTRATPRTSHVTLSKLISGSSGSPIQRRVFEEKSEPIEISNHAGSTQSDAHLHSNRALGDRQFSIDDAPQIVMGFKPSAIPIDGNIRIQNPTGVLIPPNANLQPDQLLDSLLDTVDNAQENYRTRSPSQQQPISDAAIAQVSAGSSSSPPQATVTASDSESSEMPRFQQPPPESDSESASNASTRFRPYDNFGVQMLRANRSLAAEMDSVPGQPRQANTTNSSVILTRLNDTNTRTTITPRVTANQPEAGSPGHEIPSAPPPIAFGTDAILRRVIANRTTANSRDTSTNETHAQVLIPDAAAVAAATASLADAAADSLADKNAASARPATNSLPLHRIVNSGYSSTSLNKSVGKPAESTIDDIFDEAESLIEHAPHLTASAVHVAPEQLLQSGLQATLPIAPERDEEIPRGIPPPVVDDISIELPSSEDSDMGSLGDQISSMFVPEREINDITMPETTTSPKVAESSASTTPTATSDIPLPPSTFTPFPDAPTTFTPFPSVPTTFTPFPDAPTTFTPFPDAPTTFTPFPKAESTFTPFPKAESTFAPFPSAPSTLNNFPSVPSTFTPFPAAPETLKPFPTPEQTHAVPSSTVVSSPLPSVPASPSTPLTTPTTPSPTSTTPAATATSAPPTQATTTAPPPPPTQSPTTAPSQPSSVTPLDDPFAPDFFEEEEHTASPRSIAPSPSTQGPSAKLAAEPELFPLPNPMMNSDNLDAISLSDYEEENEDDLEEETEAAAGLLPKADDPSKLFERPLPAGTTNYRTPSSPDSSEGAAVGRQPVPAVPVGIAAALPSAVAKLGDGILERVVKSGDEELPFDSTPMCGQPADPGPCFEYVARWFYNSKTGKCEQFSYGSCGGNQNNFGERATCELRCMMKSNEVLSQVPERCSFKKDVGNGAGYAVKWYFNMRNLRCEEFIFEGLGGNANQFDSLTDCERFCTPQPVSFDASAKTPIEDEELLSSEHSDAISLPHLPDFALSPDQAENIPFTSIDDAAEKRISAVVEKKKEQPAPAIRAAKTVVKTAVNYKAEPIAAASEDPATVSEVEQLPIVGASPPEAINYQTGQINRKVAGIRTFQQGNSRISLESALDAEEEDDESLEDDNAVNSLPNMPSCPNGVQELRYADGRAVMCLPGKNQCPERSVCFFNGLDYFCCPEEDDPYDKHIFGGYNGEEEKVGYKRFGPLNIRRLRDDLPVLRRAKREADFGADFTAPLRFDGKPIVQIASARPANVRRHPGSRRPKSICDYPLSKGGCAEQHLRYFYDKQSDSCSLFHYSGCEGNANNFGSIDDCQSACVKRAAAAELESEQQKLAARLPPGQCPSGHPLGGQAPVLCGNSTESIGCPKGFFCRNGPPDVCCPDLSLSAIISSRAALTEAPTPPTTTTTAPLLLCPDAADPLRNKNGKIRSCGSGFDGLKMCPMGFYCAIDSEQGTRLCCPLLGSPGSPNSGGKGGVIPPLFGRRQSSSSEVADRGSLPADQLARSSLPASKAVAETDFDDAVPLVERKGNAPLKNAAEEEDWSEEESEESEPVGQMSIKGGEQLSRKQTADELLITSGELSVDEPIASVPNLESEQPALPAKDSQDRSRCLLKPDEGRPCRAEEELPRSNLHYFYSKEDGRCKLFFFKGCGGNENRFDRKTDCESVCLVA